MPKEKNVTLYRYYNTDKDGALRCEVIAAKKTAKGYTYNHHEKAPNDYGKGYSFCDDDDIGRLTYAGVGSLFMLARNDDKARKMFLERLNYKQTEDIRRAEDSINLGNGRIIALGGEAQYPHFRVREEEQKE
ncbi:MAG: hypothetical protein PHI98_14855 [Eubacteriales bacterium]|nr:hypothetical protein [Eubacteriales bacterium]